MDLDIDQKANKRKQSFSLSSDDSSVDVTDRQSNLSPLSNMGNRPRRKRKATLASKEVYQASTRRNDTNTSKHVAKTKVPKPAVNTKTTKTAVNTSNTYAELTDNDDENIVAIHSHMKPKTVKVPPIICIDANYNDIINLIKATKIENYSLKYISMGLKVFCSTLDDYEMLCSSMKSNNVQFFTHDVSSRKTQKFVLSGLPNFEISEVKEALQQEKLEIIDVKKMKTKSDNVNHALFLVYFNNNSTNLQNLRKVKFILNVCVDWKPYQQARNGPTQCNNCQLYGHGNKNCHLKPRCAKCGLKHLTSACMKDQQPQPEAQFIHKCCLCGGDHSSKDKSCPKRLSYIEMRLNKSHASSPKNPSAQFRPKSQPQPTRSTGQTTSRSVSVTANQKYSDWLKPTPQHDVITHPPEELLSNDLLTEMMIELFKGLRASRTRLDQIQTVASVVLKYSTIDNYD